MGIEYIYFNEKEKIRKLKNAGYYLQNDNLGE